MPEPTKWCVNFDNDETVLAYGLKNNMWLMQYQYAHDGHVYQGNPKQKGATTKNWRRLGQIKEGDMLVAYIPQNTYYAVGKVRSPRKPATQRDTIERVTSERNHNQEGVVWYTDVFYEDFTDNFRLPVTNYYSEEPEVWQYNQRIDVDEWKFFVENGVKVTGLGSLKPRPDFRSAAFRIPDSFFEEIKETLSKQSPEADQDGRFTPHLKNSAAKANDEGYFEPANIMVRCRVRKHLESLIDRFRNLIGEYEIKEFTGTDYAYRIFIPKAVWSQVVVALTEEMDYDNFKSKVAQEHGHDAYEHALHDVWSVMYRLQK